MIPTMDGALLYLEYVKTVILFFCRWSMVLNTRWIKKLACKFFGHDMLHKKEEWIADYDLHIFECKRCGIKKCIELNKETKIFSFYHEKSNKTPKNS